MKKRHAYILAIMITIALLMLFLGRMCRGTSKYYEHQPIACLDSGSCARLQNGDVILRHGFGFISNTIAKYAHDKYSVSHCGVLIQTADSSWYVIHTVSNSLAKIDGMQLVSLPKFLSESHENSIIIQRYVSQDKTAGKKIARSAWNYYQQKIPFDDEFNFDDSTEFFCTEMIWHVFKNALNVNLLKSEDENDYSIMNFAMLFDTLHFTTIVNQFDEIKSSELCK